MELLACKGSFKEEALWLNGELLDASSQQAGQSKKSSNKKDSERLKQSSGKQAGQSAHFYLFDLDYDAFEDDEGQGQCDYSDEDGASCIFTVDSTVYGNISHFFNHSCDPNLVVRPCFLASQDRRFHDLCFFSCRDIQAGEELCFDYAGRQDEEEPEKDIKTKGKNGNNGKSEKNSKKGEKKSSSSLRRPMIECLCGSEKCRKYVFF